MELLKVIIIFIFIIVLLSLRKPLGVVMLAACVLLGVLFLIPPLTFIRQVCLSAVSFNTIQFILVLFFIMLIENIMSKRGYMKKMLESMTALFNSRKLNIATMPALIGLMPSAGGALFSAPIVKKAAEDTPLNPLDMSFVNNYYRHVMEIFFPTYPTVLLAVQISGVSLGSYIAAMLPYAVLTAALGLWYLRKIPNHETRNNKVPLRDKALKVLSLLQSLWPLLLMIVLIVAFNVPAHIAAAITFVALLFISRIRPKEMPRLFRQATNWRILLMVLGVMVFKDLLAFSGALPHISGTIATIPMPGFLIFVLIFFLISLITGMMMSTIAIALPIALAAMPGGGMPLLVLLTMAAYTGNMITPMHLCSVITCDYYKVDLKNYVIKALPPYMIILAVSIAVYLLWVAY